MDKSSTEFTELLVHVQNSTFTFASFVRSSFVAC